MTGYHIWFLIILAAGLAAYFMTYRHAHLWPSWAYRAAWIVSAFFTAYWLFMIFSLLLVHGRAELWVIQLRSYRALEWTQPLLGVFAALAQRLSNGRKMPKGAFSRHNGVVLMAFLVFPLHLDNVVFPCQPRWAHEWKDGVCLQSEGYTCAAAATATILRLHGRQVSEEEVCRRILMTAQGASTWDVLRYLRQQGLRPKLFSVPAQPADLPVPCLAMVRLGDQKGIPHMIAILGKTAKKFVIADPLGGKFEWSREMTWKNYYFSGVVIHVPN